MSTQASQQAEHKNIGTPRILVVEDQRDIAFLIKVHLEARGYHVELATDGAQALALANRYRPDLIILDLVLPDSDGMELCRQFRNAPETSFTPIIMCTSRTSVSDRIQGLELGADDYVTKPFNIQELALRVRNVLKRAGIDISKSSVLEFPPLRIDLNRNLVEVGGTPVSLTPTEFRLLVTLAQRRGQVQTRQTLLRDVWYHDPSAESRTVDTYIRRLREKLGPAAHWIETVRKIGYRFRDRLC